MVRLQLDGSEPVGTGAPEIGPRRKAGRPRGSVAALKDAPNPNGLGCGKCRGSEAGCAQCKQWLQNDPSRKKGTAWVPTDNMYPKSVARPPASRRKARGNDNAEPLVLPDPAAPPGPAPGPAPGLAPGLAPGPGPAPANDGDDGNGNAFPNVSGDRESALMVVCDPSYAGSPVEPDDLVEIEKTRFKLWKRDEARGRRGRLTGADKAQREREIAQQIRYTHLVRSLPKHKCCARPFTGEELAQLDANRETIDAARSAMDGPRAVRVRNGIAEARELAESNAREARTFDPKEHTDRALAEMGNRSLLEYMGPFLPDGADEDALQLVRDELQFQIARAAMEPSAEVHEQAIRDLALGRSAEVKERMLKDYYDFMNEERRLIVTTIRNANSQVEDRLVREKLEIRPANRDELEAVLLADQEDEWRAYFDGTRAPEFASTSGFGAGGAGYDNDDGETFIPLDDDAWVHCGGGAPPTPFDVRLDWAADREQYREENAKAWCRHEVRSNDTFPAAYKSTALAQVGRGKPGQRWTFPFDQARNEILPGFWTALRRVREVKDELGVSRVAWVAQEGFDEDPLIRAGQMVKIVTGQGSRETARIVVVHGEEKFIKTTDMSLLMQLRRKEVGEAVAHSSSHPANYLFATELLRCFPVMQTGKKVNSIIEFVCWWHKTITANEDGARESFLRNNRDPASQYSEPKGVNERKLMLYDLMCCPDCTTYSAAMLQNTHLLKDDDGEQLVPKWAKGLRGLVNDRVGQLAKMVKTIKNALDTDVFKTPKSESVLWRGGYLYWEYKKRYEELNAPFARVDKLRAKVATLEAEHDKAEELLEGMRERADTKTSECLDPYAPASVCDRAIDEAQEMYEEVARLQVAHKDAVERLDAARDELQEAMTAQADAGVTEDQRVERDLARDLFLGTDKPSANDVKCGQYVYERWKALNPLR
ncbi:MAG: hypothetical protein CMB11_07680 [Euryarchaeota archaeon]|nr:hypothetical protein [Euryarchaeota archaeon]